MGIGITLSHENKGDSLPLISMLSLLGGVIVAVLLSRQTLFARIDSSLKHCFWVLVSMAAFDIAAVTIGFLLS